MGIRNLGKFPVVIASFVKAAVILFSLPGVRWLTAFGVSVRPAFVGNLSRCSRATVCPTKMQSRLERIGLPLPPYPKDALPGTEPIHGKHHLYVYSPKATCPLLEVLNLIIPFPPSMSIECICPVNSSFRLRQSSVESAKVNLSVFH